MHNRLIDQKRVKQVLVDAGLHKMLKKYAADQGKTIKDVLEEVLGELLSVENEATIIRNSFPSPTKGKQGCPDLNWEEGFWRPS